MSERTGSTPRLLKGMWTLTALLAVVALPGVALGMQSRPKSAPAASSLRFEKSEENYGRYLFGEVFSRRFTVHNDGDSPLTIDRVTSKCSCARIVDFSSSIGPGESGYVEMEITTRKIATGWSRKRINVFSDDQRQKRAIYEFLIEVIPAVKISPDPLVLAGLHDQEKTAEVRVSGLARWKVSALKANSRQSLFTVQHSAVTEGLGTLTLKAAKHDSVETLPDLLQLEVTLVGGKQLFFEEPVAVRHENTVVIEPGDILRFSNPETDPLLKEGAAPVTKSVSVFTRSPDLEFEILEIFLDGIPEGVLETKLVMVEAGRRYRVEVTIPAYPTQSYVSGELVVKTTDPRCPECRTKVMAMFGKRRRRKG